jgi:hypothetical protein
LIDTPISGVARCCEALALAAALCRRWWKVGPGKLTIVVAVQSIDGGKPARRKIWRIARFEGPRVMKLAKRIEALTELAARKGRSD